MTSALGRLVIHLAVVVGLLFLFPYLDVQYGNLLQADFYHFICNGADHFAPSYIQILGPYMCIAYLLEGWWRSRKAGTGGKG